MSKTSRNVLPVASNKDSMSSKSEELPFNTCASTRLSNHSVSSFKDTSAEYDSCSSASFCSLWSSSSMRMVTFFACMMRSCKMCKSGPFLFAGMDLDPHQHPTARLATVPPITSAVMACQRDLESKTWHWRMGLPDLCALVIPVAAKG